MSAETYRVFRIGLGHTVEFTVLQDNGSSPSAARFSDFSPFMSGAEVSRSAFTAVQAVACGMKANLEGCDDVDEAINVMQEELEKLDVAYGVNMDLYEWAWPTEYGDYYTEGFCQMLALELGVDVESFRHETTYPHLYGVTHDKIEGKERVYQVTTSDLDRIKKDVFEQDPASYVYKFSSSDPLIDYKNKNQFEAVFKDMVSQSKDKLVKAAKHETFRTYSFTPNNLEVGKDGENEYYHETVENAVVALFKYCEDNHTYYPGVPEMQSVAFDLGRHLRLPSVQEKLNLPTAYVESWLWCYSEEIGDQLKYGYYPEVGEVDFTVMTCPTEYLAGTKSIKTYGGNYKLSELENATTNEQEWLGRRSQDKEVLAKLASFDITEVNLNVAQNPYTDLETLEKLATLPDPDVRWAVSANENISSKTLIELSKDTNKYVRNQALKRAPESALPSNYLEQDKDMQASLAVNPSTPVRVLWRLAEDSELLLLVLANRAAPKELLYDFMDEVGLLLYPEDENYQLLLSIARNEATPSDILEKLGRLNNKEIIREVARNKNTPPEILNGLAQMDEEDIVVEVAGNPATPIVVILKLAQSGFHIGWKIQAAAIGNERLDQTSLQAIYDQAVQNDSLNELLVKALLENGFVIEQTEALALLASFGNGLAGVVSEKVPVEKNSLLHKYLDKLEYVPKSIREEQTGKNPVIDKSPIR